MTSLPSLAVTLLFLGTAASGEISSKAGPHRHLLQRPSGQQRSGVCAGIQCPDKSTCTDVGGVPTCKCPSSFRRLVGRGSSYVCSNRAQSNSDYIDPQNAARAAVGAPPLVWNETYAARAAEWVRTLRNSFRCQARIQSNRNGWGQNVISQEIVPGFAPRIDTKTAMNRWVRQGINYTSVTRFDPGSASGCATGLWQDCSTYLQVVWQYTTQVGCAYAECGTNRQVWVCNYYLPGLINGDFPFSPCYKTTCTPPLVCNPNSVPPATCRASPCASLNCQRGATCALSQSTYPYCKCTSSSTAAVRDKCVAVRNSEQGVPQTNVALFPRTNFRGTQFNFRIPVPTEGDGGCVNLPSSLAGKTKSIQVVWNVRDEGTSGGTPKVCKGLAMWREANCGGRGVLYSPIPGTATFEQSDAADYVTNARSMSCPNLP